MKCYAISDIHGNIEEFNKVLKYINLQEDNKLILLGDFIHGPKSYEVLDKIMELEITYGKEKVIALMGNHEEIVFECDIPIGISKEGMFYNDPLKDNEYYKKWMEKLPRYYETDKQIFVHAGINETGKDFKEVTKDYEYIQKYPITIGKYHKDIIAGHTRTNYFWRNKNCHDIYFDGSSHYFIDGSVNEGGQLNVLMYDDLTDKYYELKNNRFIKINYRLKIIRDKLF